MEYLLRYSLEQARRHDVKPGITGWAQVNGRNAITWDEKFELDVWYVDNKSFWLDLKILWMTAVKVFKSEGINQKGQATMEEFMGTRAYKINQPLCQNNRMGVDLKNIVVIGAGGFGAEAIWVLEDMNRLNSKALGWNIIGYVDDDTSKRTRSIMITRLLAARRSLQ